VAGLGHRRADRLEVLDVDGQVDSPAVRLGQFRARIEAGRALHRCSVSPAPVHSDSVEPNAAGASASAALRRSSRHRRQSPGESSTTSITVLMVLTCEVLVFDYPSRDGEPATALLRPARKVSARRRTLHGTYPTDTAPCGLSVG